MRRGVPQRATAGTGWPGLMPPHRDEPYTTNHDRPYYHRGEQEEFCVQAGGAKITSQTVHQAENGAYDDRTRNTERNGPSASVPPADHDCHDKKRNSEK